MASIERSQYSVSDDSKSSIRSGRKFLKAKQVIQPFVNQSKDHSNPKKTVWTRWKSAKVLRRSGSRVETGELLTKIYWNHQDTQKVITGPGHQCWISWLGEIMRGMVAIPRGRCWKAALLHVETCRNLLRNVATLLPGFQVLPSCHSYHETVLHDDHCCLMAQRVELSRPRPSQSVHIVHTSLCT